MTVANGSKITTEGHFKNVPIMLNDTETSVNPHVLKDLSYDLILGRDWCKANGVVIDFNKERIYLLKPQSIEEIDLINQLDDKPSEASSKSIQYAELENFIGTLS